MTQAPNVSIHASAVCVGAGAILIRGPSGSGKSRLAFDLIIAGRGGQIPATELVGDDRTYLERSDNAIIVRPAPDLAGLIEIRGLGIRRCDFIERAPVELVVDLAAEDAERLPPPDALSTWIDGIKIPRIPIGAGYSALPIVVSAIITTSDFMPRPWRL